MPWFIMKVNAIDPTKESSGNVVAMGRQALEPGHYYVTGGNELTVTMRGIPVNLVLYYKAGTLLLNCQNTIFYSWSLYGDIFDTFYYISFTWITIEN